MLNYNEKALAMHKNNCGKIGTQIKVPLETIGDLSTAYTPGVAAVSKAIANDPKLVSTHTPIKNTVAVITDGTAVLGLGDIGPQAAYPVMEGKCCLFKKFANIDAVPICLGTKDTEEIIKTVQNLAPTFGGINLEDISAPRCFEIEKRLDKLLDIPVFHDDQHGTAIVVVAALLNSLKLVNKKKEDLSVVINGAGAAGVAITDFLIYIGIKNIVVLDSRGIISKDRGDLNSSKKDLAEKTNPKQINGGLEKAMNNSDLFIGVSVGNVVTEDMIRSMNDKPIIFALANPTPEINPKVAKNAGAFIVATGRSDYPNQINNVLAFPGIFRGALDSGARSISMKMKVKTAETLAMLVKEPDVNCIIPSIFINNLSYIIGKEVEGVCQ